MADEKTRKRIVDVDIGPPLGRTPTGEEFAEAKKLGWKEQDFEIRKLVKHNGKLDERKQQADASLIDHVLRIGATHANYFIQGGQLLKLVPYFPEEGERGEDFRRANLPARFEDPRKIDIPAYKSLRETIDRAVRGVKVEMPRKQEPLLLEDKNLRSKESNKDKQLKPVVEGFVWHGHFEGSDEIAYLHKGHAQWPQWRKGVPRAQVRIWGPYADMTATTDDRGHYAIYGPPPNYTIPPGEYHMRAERGVRPERVPSGQYIGEGASGGYLADYKDKVNIPPPRKLEAFNQNTGQWVIVERPETIHENFELKPLGEMHHKVSFTGGTGKTRDDIRKILKEHKDLGYDKAGIAKKIKTLRASGAISPEEARYIAGFLKTDLNEAKKLMIEAEILHKARGDESFKLKNSRYMPSAIGRGNVFSKVTENFKSQIIKNAGLLIAGMVASAIIGSPLFVFAFLCWMVSSTLPTPKDYNHIQDRIAQINDHYEGLKKSENYTKASADVLANLEEQRKNDIMISISMLRDFKMQDVAGSTVLKEVLKIAGLALFSLAFVLSSLPFAKPAGVVAALVAYMMIKYERTDTGVHEKGKARWLSRIISQEEV